MENNLEKTNINNEQTNNKVSNTLTTNFMKNKELLLKIIKETIDTRLIKLEKRNKNHLSIIELTKEEIKRITNWSINANKQIKDKLKKDKEKEKGKEKLIFQSKFSKSKKKDSSGIERKSLLKSKTPLKSKRFKTFISEEIKNDTNTSRKKLPNKSYNPKLRKSLGNKTKSLPFLRKEKKKNTINLNKTINNINLVENELGRPSIISNKSNKSNKVAILNKTQKERKNNLKINNNNNSNNKNVTPVRKKTPYKKRTTNTRNEKIEDLNGFNNINNLTIQNKENNTNIKSEIFKKEENKSSHEININKMESALQKDELLNNNDPLLIAPITDFDFYQNSKLSTKTLNSVFNIIERKNTFDCNLEKTINDKLYSIISDYLSIYDLIQFKNVSKYFNKLFFSYILIKLQKDKDYFINQKNNLDVINIPPILTIKDFVLSKGSTKAIKLLNEPHLNYLFSEKSEPNDDRIIIYKIFFQLINHPLKDIPNDKKEEFWSKCQDYFSHENDGKTGGLIQKIVDEKMIDIEGNNLYKIYKLVYKDLKKIYPQFYSNICGTTGLFTFFIKDILDFVGISIDEKIQKKAYWSYAKIIDSIEKKIDHIKKLKNI